MAWPAVSDSVTSTDFIQLIHVRDQIDSQGSQLPLLAEHEAQDTTENFVLTGQPLCVTQDWSEQSMSLTPDPTQWTCLGARESLKNVYGSGDIDAVPKDVNVDTICIEEDCIEQT